MIEVLSLSSYGSFGGSAFGQMMAQWEQMGIFSYVIPFLLIFALVFGILSKINIFGKKGGDGTENRTLNALIALAVSFMSLQFDFVSIFFAEIFPRMGVALAGVLVLLVVGGIFIDPDNKGFMVGLMAIAMIVFGAIIISSLNAFGWRTDFFYSSWWMANNSWIISLGILILFVVAIIISSKPKTNTPPVNNILGQLLRGP